MTQTNWMQNALEMLDQASEEGRQAADYLRCRPARVRFRSLTPSAGAIWLPFGNIFFNTHYFNPEAPFSNPRLLCLLVHETRHLMQGPVTALSIYGELDAWQVDFRLHRALTGRTPNAIIEEMLEMPLNWDRAVLKRAQTLMQDFAGKGYRSDLLPLYPLPKELRYRLTGQTP